ncbi:glycosyltransferase family 2 protein [Microlunatus parietis]|uniref:Glycosyltransferase 2-like domain-containing protein n=1 Tax=Microlunatus parietis TaxID=682979 RepID=A0A7Y9LG29_9ACTN|nr:glycosyltransferase family 2 protein [Microlunatus parietis]NYE75600.1 hypothetical protein [Microlunatus parietis]
MPVEVSVLITADREPRRLAKLISSLDKQTLNPSELEIVLVSTGDGQAERLEDLAARRPNVTVRRSAGPAEAALAQAFGAASGAWTVIFGTETATRDAELLPESLRRLVDHAEKHQLDWLAAQVAYRNAKGRLTGLFRLTEQRSGGPVPPSPCILHRTERLRNASDNPGTGGVFADYACLVLGEQDGAEGPAASFAMTDAAASWQGTVLTVTATASSSAELAYTLQHRATGLEHWLPTTTEPAADGGTVVRATIDLAAEAEVPQLAGGAWGLWLTAIDGDGTGERVRVPPITAPSAVVDGTLVALGVTGNGFSLDLGATMLAGLGELPAGRATITEAAGGTLATLPAPGLHVHGDARIEGFLQQGTFPLPAELIATDGEARVECLLSGMAGSSPLLTKFGTSHAADTGLTLTIDPVGAMSIAPTPPKPAPKPPAPKPVAKPAPKPAPPKPKPAAKKKAKKKAPPTALTKLRRRVPGFLEPAVKGLSRNSAARSLYGRINRALR